MAKRKKRPPVSDKQLERLRTEMARMHDLMGRAAKKQEFKSPDELKDYLNDVLAGRAEKLPPETPLEKAQELVYDAWDSDDPKRRVMLARQALDLSPDCADAYMLLLDDVRDPAEVRKLLEQAVRAGERALGPEMFEKEAGHFWGIHETRPYMRARAALAQFLWQEGERKDAVAHLQDMMRLNPDDNQGLRYSLAGWLAAVDDRDGLDRLLSEFEDEPVAGLAYPRALLAFRQEGDSEKARKLLQEAYKANRYVPLYLLQIRELPRELPDFIELGKVSEGVSVAAALIEAWEEDDAALRWLIDFMVTNHGADVARNLPGPKRRHKRGGPPGDREIAQAEQPRPRPVSKVAPGDSEWRRLYAAADRFGEIEPWTWFHDSDLFGVMDPETREIGYCCVMGYLGKMRALAVYRGSEGLLTYLQMLRNAGRPSPDREDMYGQDCLMAWFDAADEIEARDEAVMMTLGREVKSESRLSVFRSYQPGYPPWFINAFEARCLAVALEQALDVVTRYKGTSDQLGPTEEAAYLVRVPEPGPAGPAWQDKWLVPPVPALPELKLMPLNQVRLAKVRRKCLNRSGTWEADYRYHPRPLQDQRGERPYFARHHIILDHESGEVLAFMLGKPDVITLDLPETFFDACDERGRLPSELLVRTDNAEKILRPVADALGLGLRRVEPLPEADRFYAGLEEKLESEEDSEQEPDR